MNFEYHYPVSVFTLFNRCINDGQHCDDCQYNKTYSNYHDIGNSVAEEPLRECMVENIFDCPFADHYLNDDEFISEDE